MVYGIMQQRQSKILFALLELGGVDEAQLIKHVHAKSWQASLIIYLRGLRAHSCIACTKKSGQREVYRITKIGQTFLRELQAQAKRQKRGGRHGKL